MKRKRTQEPGPQIPDKPQTEDEASHDEGSEDEAMDTTQDGAQVAPTTNGRGTAKKGFKPQEIQEIKKNAELFKSNAFHLQVSQGRVFTLA